MPSVTHVDQVNMQGILSNNCIWNRTVWEASIHTVSADEAADALWPTYPSRAIHYCHVSWHKVRPGIYWFKCSILPTSKFSMTPYRAIPLTSLMTEHHRPQWLCLTVAIWQMTTHPCMTAQKESSCKHTEVLNSFLGQGKFCLTDNR